ncbi:hypothetical protein IHE45_13G067000 [Dioscorea alata]|uniref:Uncharacterized protein n=1 Tax=Dioscorea alata TaxID=55571 RepID=A0ACB7UYG1_DIOAL|nr:hypothetical protein IHE45_13G067000 [Dioscorea alata]
MEFDCLPKHLSTTLKACVGKFVASLLVGMKCMEFP